MLYTQFHVVYINKKTGKSTNWSTCQFFGYLVNP